MIIRGLSYEADGGFRYTLNARIPNGGQPGHVCGESCHLYGFHAFRYAQARFHYANPEPQNQMGHACASTTDHHRRRAERQMGSYGAYLPEALGQRKNSGEESGERRFRVVAG